jgi:hypothetical protein
MGVFFIGNEKSNYHEKNCYSHCKGYDLFNKTLHMIQIFILNWFKANVILYNVICRLHIRVVNSLKFQSNNNNL